jgi:serine/threonine protein kinase
VALAPYDRQRLKDVFAAARALPASDRQAYVSAACAGDEELRLEVESLLAADERAKSFLESPAVVRDGDTRVTRSLEGRRIGPYQIASRIGEGGMGEVYQARDTTLNRHVAIKVLLPAIANDPDRLARFRREAQVLASLNHPHIAQIHGFEDADGVPALVMELVEGPTLADRIVSGTIRINEALAIASQIAAALEAAHEQGIIHRDLKPANIKVREDGPVKVLDFGLATGLDLPGRGQVDLMHSPTVSAHVTETGLILGTAAYMSPEQARGRTVDKRTDVWAFGCVLYEMLTGRPVFAGKTMSDLLAAVLTTDPDWMTLPEETPAPIRKLLRRCLEKDRKRRLDSAADARLEIDDVLTSSPAEASGVARQQPAWQKWTTAVRVLTVMIIRGCGGGEPPAACSASDALRHSCTR